MASAQQPWGLNALNGEVTKPAWKAKPSWYLVATDDKMIPVPAQRMMANRAGAKTVDQAGSHAVYVSQPKAVAALIEDAARAVSN
jgi:pimeloyl-ACP methyl ester carboxylesterase